MTEIPWNFTKDLTQVKHFINQKPKWYRRKDVLGCTLLEQAMSCDEKEVFHYMVSLAEVQRLNFVLNSGLKYSLESASDSSEYYSIQLIKTGACVHQKYPDGDTLLHRAVKFRHFDLMRVLLDEGCDVNAQNGDGCTPLHLALPRYHQTHEFVTTLLCHGADPAVEDDRGYTPFEYSLVYCNSDIQQMLLDYTSDACQIHFDVLVKLAKERSDYFAKVRSETVVGSQGLLDDVKCLKCLLTMDRTVLTVLVDNYRGFIEEVLVGSVDHYICMDWNLKLLPEVSLDNFGILLDSGVGGGLSQIISTFCCAFQFVIYSAEDEAAATETLLYLLSYGLEVTEKDLVTVYDRFGYCDLLKVLLHMSYRPEVAPKNIFPALFYDLGLTLQGLLANPYVYPPTDFFQLVDYFAHWRLTELLGRIGGARKGGVRVPLLKELARNAFRPFFIEKFQIRTASRFYTLLKHLPISNFYKKIISYETKLY